MKEQKLDGLERMFREGLQDLKAEPDAAVWMAIQEATKKRRRYWLFWSLAGMLAIGLVATVLFLNDEKIKQSTVDGQRSTVDSPWSKDDGQQSTVNSPRSTVKGHDLAVESLMPSAQSLQPGDIIQSKVDSPQSTVDSPQSTVNGLGLAAESLLPTAQNLQPGDIIQYTEEPVQRWEIRDVTVPPYQFDYENAISIPFAWNAISNFKPVPSLKDSSLKPSPWSLAFNSSMLFPGVNSTGQKGTVNYDKSNTPHTGISCGLNLNYHSTKDWLFRTGLSWSSYTVSGNHRYYGLTDTVEWIDRERNTGYDVISKSRTWAFQSRYQWISIPFEVGKRQAIGEKWSLEMTLGAGINYLYSYDKLAEGNRYLSGIDEGIQRFQMNLSTGLGVNYQLNGPWSTFVNMRYLYQPNPVYESQMLTEKHQMLGFGIGLQYRFKGKGN